LGKAGVRFRRHGSGVRWAEKSPWALRPRGQGAIGAPSAGLSLGRLRARRAYLRFTRRDGFTAINGGDQEQGAEHGNQQKCHGHEGRTECSEGTLVFCLDNGVHFRAPLSLAFYARS